MNSLFVFEPLASGREELQARCRRQNEQHYPGDEESHEGQGVREARDLRTDKVGLAPETVGTVVYRE